MTRLQKEVRRQLPKTGCTARYDEQTGNLNIDCEGAELLSLHGDDIIYFKKENHQTEQRREQYHEVKDLIDKAAEYVRLYERALQMEAQDVKQYRRLASYNGVVLAGMEDDTHGFMFTTWNESADRRFVTNGDYSPNYEYVKEAFATRSGLIDKQRLFNDKQMEVLLRCLHFTAENDESLTYEQERNISKLADQIGGLLPPGIAAQEPKTSLGQTM